MSLHLGVVSIEGNRLLELAEVLRKDGYLIDQETTVDTSREAVAAAEEQPDRLHVTKVAYSEDDFTHLLDLEMVLQHNDVWLEYSRKWVCRVIGWICEGASSTFQLSVCDRGEWIRHVGAQGDAVMLAERGGRSGLSRRSRKARLGGPCR